MAFSTIAIPSKDVQAAKAFYEVYVGGGMLAGTNKDPSGSVVGLRQLPTA